jgi:hypothetical protein
MAKNSKNKIDDIFKVDPSLDFDSFDFPDFDAKDDRKPIVRVGSGLKEGAISGLRDSSFIKRTIRDNLPKGFGETMDLSDKISQSVKDLYDESAKDIKPALKETKRILTKLIPRDSKLLPDAAKKLLSKWEDEQKEDNRYAAVSKDGMREATISSQQADIFKINMKQHAADRAYDEGKDRLQEGIAFSRHNDIFSLLNRSAMSLDRLSKYNTSINLGYQKKSLELQYRNLFALQDILSFSREDATRKETIFRDILKNTGLPEFVKISKSEAKKQIGENKFRESMYQGLYGGRDQFLQKTLNNVKSMAVNKVKDFTSSFMGGLSEAEMAKDMSSGTPIDGYKLGGNMVGSSGAQWLGGKAAGYLKGKASKMNNPLANKVKGIGKTAFDFIQNAGQKANKLKNDRSYDYLDGPKAMLMRMFQDIIPGTGVDTSVNNATSKDMDAPWQLTRRTDKSINEVIPGYLSRILREIQVLRTNDTGIELTQYSYDKGGFTSKSKLEKATLRKIIDKDSSIRLQTKLDDMITDIESESGTKFSEPAKKTLRKLLLNNSTSNQEASKENLLSKDAIKGMNEEDANQIVPAMKAFYGKQTIDKKISFDKKSNDLVDAIADPRYEIQQAINMGDIAYLKKMGIVDKDGKNIDLERVMDLMLVETKDGTSAPKESLYRGKARDAGSAAFANINNIVNKPTSLVQTGKDALIKAKDGAVNYANRDDGLKKDTATVVNFITGLTQTASNTTSAAKESIKTSASGLMSKDLEGLQANVVKMTSAAKDKVMSTAADAAEAVADVYVEGEESPRLQAVKMKLGKYIDALTGKIITHQEQINGDVKDEKGETVIKADELPLLRVYSVRTNRFAAIRFIGRVALSILKGGWKFQTTTAVKWTLFNFRALSAITKGIFKATKWFFGVGREEPKDVYVGNEATPRLYKTRMLNGEYKDCLTGKVITHQDKICGAVEDADGTIVLNEDDLMNLRVYDSIFKTLNPFRLTTAAIKMASKGISWLAGKAQKAAIKTSAFLLRSIKNVSVGIVKKVFNFFTEPVDVYVIGVNIPALVGKLMKAGAYFSFKTKKAINLPSDIDGPVTDEKGEIILTEQDIEKGLTDVSGKPIKTTLLQKLGKGLGMLSKLFSTRRKLKVDVKTLTAAQGVLKNKNSTTGDKTVALLTQVRDAILKTGPKGKVLGDTDGDGIAENSRAGKLKKKAAQLKDALTGKSGKTDDKGKPKSVIDNALEEGIMGWLKDKALMALGLGGGGVGLWKTLTGGAPSAAAAAEGAVGAAGNATGAATNAAGTAANTASTAANATKTAAAAAEGATGLGSGAAGAARAGGSMLGSAGRVLGKVAAPLAGAVSAYDEYGNAKNKDLSTSDKVIKAGSAGIGGAGGALAGGALGSTIGAWGFGALGGALGSIVPGAGTVAGAAAGATFGTWVGGATGAWLGSKGGAALGSSIGENFVNHPDSESTPRTADGSAGSASGIDRAVGNLPLAGGDMADGSSASAFINAGSGVVFGGSHPTMLKNFYGMVQEYGSLTGKKITVTSAFRTYAEQQALYNADPRKAAKPGNSMHEFGLAIDIDSKDADILESMGLMRKYGFTRPLGGEPWHIEPAGIQTDRQAFKRDPSAADKAITAGLNRGGSGIGADRSSKLGQRDDKLSLSILNAARTPNVDPKAVPGAISNPTDPLSVIKGVADKTQGQTPSPSGIIKTSFNPNSATPASTIGGESNSGVGSMTGVGSASPSGVTPINNNLIADPTVDVPAPTGSGIEGMRATITAAAKLVGVDPDVLLKSAAVESGFNSNASNKMSSAGGLFQFVDDTWAAMINRHGGKYGFNISNTSKNNPVASSIMAAHYLKDNVTELGKKTNRAIGTTEAYLAHFLGAGGATGFLNTLDTNPNAIAAQLMPKPAASNPSIFYDGTRPRTVGEMYTFVDKRVRDKLASFGLSSGAPIVAANTPLPSAGGSNSAGVATAPPTNTPEMPSGMLKAGFSNTPASAYNDQSNSPLATSFGSRTMQDNMVTSPNGPNNQMPSEIFGATNSILTQSLEVQKLQLDMMQRIFGVVSKGDTGGNFPAATMPDTQNPMPPTNTPYSVPKNVISVSRMTA